MVNSKGFGGNNASATLLSPVATQRLLRQRYSDKEWSAWQDANEAVATGQSAYDEGMIAGKESPVYRFDHGVLNDGDVELTADRVRVGQFEIDLNLKNPFE